MRDSMKDFRERIARLETRVNIIIGLASGLLVVLSLILYVLR